MDTRFPLTQTRCYQQAARLMARGVNLSVALRGCLPILGSHPSPTINQPITPAPAEGARSA